jgi:PAS domain S-box-containing protein
MASAPALDRIEVSLAASALASWLIDPRAVAIVAVNDAALSVLGWSRAALLDARAAQIFPDGERALAQMEQARAATKLGMWVQLAEDGRALEIEASVSSCTHDGRELLLVQSVRSGAAPSLRPPRDILERSENARRALEEAAVALERSEKNFRVLIENTPVAVIVHRAETILYANAAVTSLLGWPSPAELIGQPAFVFVAPAFRDAARARSKSLLESANFTRTPLAPGAMVRRDGTLVEVEVESVKLDFDGAPACVVLARDITERRALLSRISAADRLASLGTLAAGVAHEINNPLAYVLANLSFLAETIPDALRGKGNVAPAHIETLLHDAREGAARIRALVRDLRGLVHPDRESVTRVDMREVIATCLRMAQNEIRQRARLVTQLEEVALVKGNESRLSQVVLNLVINAVQAIPEGRVLEHEIRISLYRAASGGVALEVADTGGGIPEAILGHIFDPFFTTKPIGVGTGLGLAICHGIVSAMGGEITVDSDPPRGTTFRVLLPPWTAADGADASALVTPPPMPRLRILVIDDEAAICRSLELMWKGAHEVHSTTRASVALERLGAGESFDVILCDLMMPEMTGMKFYEALSTARPDLVSRVVFSSGGAFTPASRELIERVPNPCLEKPFDMRAVDEVLRTFVPRERAP